MKQPWTIFFAVAAAVLAAALVMMSIRNAGGSPTEPGAQPEVRVYTIPPERGEQIELAVRQMLFIGHEGATPMGQASLAKPGMLMVNAPSSLHGTLGEAIEQLSATDTPENADSASPATFMVELWLVDAMPERGNDDPALASAAAAVEAAREHLGLGRMVRVARAAAATTGGNRDASLVGRGFVAEANVIDESIRLTAVFDGSRAQFTADVPLALGRWQVIGLIGGEGRNGSDRLLLLRARDPGASVDAGSDV